MNNCSEIFIFVLFVVILVGGAVRHEVRVRAAALRKSPFQLVVDAGDSLRVFHVVDQGFAKAHPDLL